LSEVVRVAALTGYFHTMRTLGADPRPLLRECGLSAESLRNPEQLISARAANRLLERSAEVTGCLTLGLHMAENRALANLGVTSLLIAHQPTLRLALHALREFRNRINSRLILHIEDRGDETVLREDFALRNADPTRQASGLALGVLMRLCSSVLGEHWSPVAVCFSHGAPPSAEMGVYRRLFHCSAHFSCEFNGIVIRTGDLDLANVRADSALAEHARGLIESVTGPEMRSASQDTEQLIMLLLPSGQATIQNIADSMGLTVRTLQRRLDADDASFSDLLNRARMQLAVQYLANPRIRVTDIAEFLGYSSIGAFTRWHTGTFGLSPREWRAAGKGKKG
jgi:AraC-like DNA-binding protein